MRHSGGERRLFTSAMVTLYLEVELSRDKRPGTEQNRSVGFTTQVPPKKKKKKIKVRETPRLCFDKLNHEEQFCDSLVAGFVWVWFFLGVCSLACYNIIVLREMSVLEFQ